MVLWIMTTKLCYYLCPGGRHSGPHFVSHVFWKMVRKLAFFVRIEKIGNRSA